MTHAHMSAELLLARRGKGLFHNWKVPPVYQARTASVQSSLAGCEAKSCRKHSPAGLISNLQLVVQGQRPKRQTALLWPRCSLAQQNQQMHKQGCTETLHHGHAHTSYNTIHPQKCCGTKAFRSFCSKNSKRKHELLIIALFGVTSATNWHQLMSLAGGCSVRWTRSGTKTALLLLAEWSSVSAGPSLVLPFCVVVLPLKIQPPHTCWMGKHLKIHENTTLCSDKLEKLSKVRSPPVCTD